MGSDFSRKWHLESSRVVWIVALVLASVLVVQFFDMPSQGRVLSLFPLGSSHFNSSGPYGGINGGVGYGQQSNLVNHSLPVKQESGEGSVSEENAVLEDMPDIKRTDEEDSMVRTASIVPEKASTSSEISPSAPADVSPSVIATASVAPAPYEAIDEKFSVPTSNSSAVLVSGAGARIAPSLTASDVSSSTVSAPSESASPRESDVGVEPEASRNESNVQPPSVNSPPPPTPPVEQPKISENPSVATISDMNEMLLRSRASSFSEVYR